MLQYTQATLHTALTSWNVNSDPTFVSTLPEIVRRGELRLAKLLDLDNLDGKETTVTAASTLLVVKPTSPVGMINERVVTVNVAGSELLVRKRSRAWCQLYNKTGATGTPQYYAEADETHWAFVPIPAGVYTVTVHGAFLIPSIEDGAGSTVTWFSTNVPDLLYYACSIEACEFLKFWAKKADNDATLNRLAGMFELQSRKIQRVDDEELQMDKQTHRPTGAAQ